MRILLATDGSNDAKVAVEWLRHLPLPPDREMLVITVFSPPVLPIEPDMLDELRTALIAEARRLADDTAAELNVGRATGRVVEGDPRREIIDAARSWGADLIVLGARGLGAIREFLLGGSVSLSVVRDAPCPVLVCKGSPRDVRTVTVGLDGSEHARAALAWLAALPLPAAVRVRLLGVAESQHYPSSAPGILGATLHTAVAAVEGARRAALEKELTAAAATLLARVRTEVSALTGKPADVIVREAEEDAADLVVVGSRGAGALTRLLLGSVSESVLRHAPCPVLVVRSRVTDVS
jgi:nucleotide-binding universal stress UspA family protein